MDLPFSAPVIVAHLLAPAVFIVMLTSHAEPCCPWSAFAFTTASPSSAGPRFVPSPLSAYSSK